MAKFPSIRYKRKSVLATDPYGIDGNGGFGLPQRPSDGDWTVFRGGVDDVIYPSELRKIAKLWQRGTNTDADGLPLIKAFGPSGQPPTPWFFGEIKFECEISCEGIPTVPVEKVVPEDAAAFSK